MVGTIENKETAAKRNKESLYQEYYLLLLLFIIKINLMDRKTLNAFKTFFWTKVILKSAIQTLFSRLAPIP